MALIRIAPSQVRAKASELRNLSTQFKTKADSLKASEETVASQWEGEAKEAFRADFQKDEVNMGNFYGAIEKYCTELENIANELEKADILSAQS